MAYIGKQPTVGNFQVCDAISTVNGQATYNLTVSSVAVTPETANHVLCSVNGVLQKPGSSFTIVNSTIVFSSNLATGDVINFVHILGSVLDLGVPSDSTVSLAKLTATGTKNSTTFLRGDNTFAAPGGGKVLQVVTISKTDTHSESISANAMSSSNITGMSPAITCAATSSKVLILGNFLVGRNSNDANSAVGIQMLRGTTLIGNGDAASSRSRVATMVGHRHDIYMNTLPIMFLDSPSSTSELTYNFRFLNSDGDTSTLYLNRSHEDSDGAYIGRGASSITLIEIGA